MNSSNNAVLAADHLGIHPHYSMLGAPPLHTFVSFRCFLLQPFFVTDPAANFVGISLRGQCALSSNPFASFYTRQHQLQYSLTIGPGRPAKLGNVNGQRAGISCLESISIVSLSVRMSEDSVMA